jgi:hypothetical protein
VTRLPRLALLTFASVVIAAGCGGSSGTPTPPPIKDANEVIVKSVDNIAYNATSVKSLHVKFEISGTLNLGSLTSGSGLGSSFDLAGTTIEGDVDVANQAADLKLSAPGLLALKGEGIFVGGKAYYTSTLTNPDGKFKVVDTSSTPISLPSPTAMASGQIAKDIADFTNELTGAGATTTLKGNEKVAGKDAYHVSINFPVDKLNAMLAGTGGGTTAGMTLDSATIDYWVYTDTVLPAKLAISASSAQLGNLTLTATLSDYGKSVSISAPTADKISS